MAQTTSTSSNFANFPQEYVAKRLLAKGERVMVYDQYAEHKPFPKGANKTVRFGRYVPVGVALQALTEGSNPTPDAITIDQITATLSQFGKAVKITRVHELTVMHPTFQEAVDELERSMRYSREYQLQDTLNAETGVTYANGKTTRATLAATDVTDTVMIRKGVSKIKNPDARGRSAPRFGKHYGGSLHEKMVLDLLDDPIWSAAGVRQAKQLAELKEGVVNIWHGTEWMENNYSPELENLGDPTLVDNTAVVQGDLYSGAPSTLVGATFNPNNGGGSLSASTAYDFLITAIHKDRGFEEKISGTLDISTGAGEQRISVVYPDDTDYVYNLYAGTNGGTLYLADSYADADGTFDVDSIPTSGNTAPTAPAEGVTVFTGHVFGEGAFARVTLDEVEGIIAQGPDSGNILDLFRTVGYKYMDATCVQNTLWLRRFEASSAYV